MLGWLKSFVPIQGFESGSPTLYVGTDVRLALGLGDDTPKSTHATLDRDNLSRFIASGVKTVVIARKVDHSDAEALSELPTSAEYLLINSERHLKKPIRIVHAVACALLVPIRSRDVVVVRLPEVIGTALAMRALFVRAALITNIVAGPSAHAPRLGHKFFAPALTWFNRAIADASYAVVFVTERELQEKLQLRSTVPQYSMSNVRFSERLIATRPRSAPSRSSLRVISVGGMNSDNKGFDLLIDSLKRVKDQQIPMTATLVGDGLLRERFETRAREAGLSEVVRFTGYLADREALASEFQESDIFVLASRNEGLPRAMIEAMAFGVPCIGSDVGGIRELVPEPYRFAPGDSAALARTLTLLHTERSLLSDLSETGWHSAKLIVARANSGLFARLISEAAKRRR